MSWVWVPEYLLNEYANGAAKGIASLYVLLNVWDQLEEHPWQLVLTL